MKGTIYRGDIEQKGGLRMRFEETLNGRKVMYSMCHESLHTCAQLSNQNNSTQWFRKGKKIRRRSIPNGLGDKS